MSAFRPPATLSSGPAGTHPNRAQEAGQPVAPAGKLWSWLCLAAILTIYVVAVIRLGTTSNFGTIQDDAMYFASAKALAAGQGYVLPSFPGGLSSLKYPELYPWLLSWIWRWDPSFPGNLVPAIGLTLAFGCWFLVACFLLAKKTLGLSDGWGLLVTALCAFNFFALLIGGSVLSDLPFAAIMLTAALAADRSLDPGAHWTWAVVAGALAGLSVGLRTLGIMIVAGMVVVALVRRRYGRAALFCGVSGVVAAPWLWATVVRALAPHVEGASSLPPGWAQTLAFYASYIGQWRQFVPDGTTQLAVCTKNFLNLVEEPGIFLLLPLASGSALLSVAGGSLTSLAAWAGVLTQVRRVGWRVIHGIFIFYAAMVVPWPFPPHRFLMPFLPLMFGGLAVVVRDITGQAVGAFRQRRFSSERAAATVLALAVLALAGVTAANYGFAVPRQLSDTMAAQRSLLAEKRQAYAWIRAHTPSESNFIAYDDVLLYLYTGRKAVRPIACSTENFYRGDRASAERDASHISDSARYVRAAYWVASIGDFGVELGQDQGILTRRENELLAPLPELFRSQGGHVRIYDLHCFQEPAASDCRQVAGHSGL